MATGQGGSFNGGRLLSEISQKDPRLGQLLQNIVDAVNTSAKNAGVSPVGDIQAPKAPDSVKVNVSGEMAHISISHTGELQRGVRYFSEITSDDPACANTPIVIDHGTSRTPAPISLPSTRTSGSSTVQNVYSIKSYAQNPGGPPSEMTHGKTSAGATTFSMGGSTNMSLLAGHGSGTAPNHGEARGQGLGTFQTRKS